LIPIVNDKYLMSLQNTMNIIVTGLVVGLTIIFAFLIAYGYLKQPKTKKFGKITMVLAALIAVFGVFNLIAMSMGLNILGVSERLVIFSLMVLIFSISNFESFANLEYIDIKKEN